MGRNAFIIGITGKIATGKDTVSQIIASQYGFHEINTDKIGHIILQEEKDKVIKLFGNTILNNINEIDRIKLRNIVFYNKEKLQTLEKIIHPIIYNRIEQIISTNKFEKIIINAALLFKLNLAKFCNHIFIIKANDEIIKKRLRLNRNLDENLISNILKWQKDIFSNKNIINSKITNIINNKSYGYLERKIKAKMSEVT
ncbi:dephospho-CoA kinase [Borrelia persica]|uniref:dephospho-CoA kinase n=1 Tax=Borrelia persica TaxID=44448 RepID=UPI0004676466|nr:dephospho-CoA kinase [Borrelia persica]